MYGYIKTKKVKKKEKVCRMVNFLVPLCACVIEARFTNRPLFAAAFNITFSEYTKEIEGEVEGDITVEVWT